MRETNVATSCQLIRMADHVVMLAELELATTFWRRFKGLQLRRQLPAEAGLLLAPCSSLHTCFMRFAIDVIMLDRGGTVLQVRRGVRPWRVVLCSSDTRAVIETAPFVLDVQVGDRLAWVSRPEARQC